MMYYSRSSILAAKYDFFAKFKVFMRFMLAR